MAITTDSNNLKIKQKLYGCNFHKLSNDNVKILPHKKSINILRSQVVAHLSTGYFQSSRHPAKYHLTQGTGVKLHHIVRNKRH